MSISRILALVACVFLVGVGYGADATIRTLDGKKTGGELVSVSPMEIVVRTKEGEVKIATAKVLDVELQKGGAAPKDSHIEVELVDGTVLRASEFKLNKSEATIKLLSGQSIKLPLGKIGYMLREAQDAKLRKQWDESISKQGNHDLLVVNKEGVLNSPDGTLSASSEPDKIHFESSGGLNVDATLARVHGLSFFRQREAVSDKTFCKLRDLSGNLLIVEKLEKSPTGYKASTVTGAVIDYPLAQLAKLDFSRGKLTYLSDIEKPDEVIEKSALGGIDHYRRDKNLDGGPIRLLGKPYAKGLALHAYTELVYDISGEDYKEFKALMGIDDQVGGDSHVIVVIEADGQELFKGELRRQDRKTIPIAVNIVGKKKLRIIVRSANLLGLGDHVDLAEARVSK